MLGMFNKVNNIADSDQMPHSDKLGQIEGACIGETNFIQGSISGEDDLLIQGRVKGNIDLIGHQLTVGPKGNVEADIKAERVVVNGRLKGNVKTGDKVEIKQNADFDGEIKAKRISVEDGAYVRAVVELERESAAKNVSKQSVKNAETEE